MMGKLLLVVTSAVTLHAAEYHIQPIEYEGLIRVKAKQEFTRWYKQEASWIDAAVAGIILMMPMVGCDGSSPEIAKNIVLTAGLTIVILAGWQLYRCRVSS